MPMTVNPVTRVNFQPVQPTGWDAYPQKKEEVKGLLLGALQEQVDDRFRDRGELAPHFMYVDAREYLRLVLNEFPDVLDAHFASYINNPDQSLKAVTDTFLRENYQQIGARFETFAREAAKGTINHSLQGMLRQQPYLTYSDVFGADDAPFLDGGSGVTFFAPGGGLSVVPPARGAGSQHAQSLNSGGGDSTPGNRAFYDEVVASAMSSASRYTRVDGQRPEISPNFDKWGVFNPKTNVQPQALQEAQPAAQEMLRAPANAPVDTSGYGFTDSSEISKNLNLKPQPGGNPRVILETPTTPPDDPRQAKVNEIKRMFAELSDTSKSEDGLRRIAREMNEVQTLFDDAGGCVVLDGRITKSFDTLRKGWAALADPVALKRLDNAILAFNANPGSQRALETLHKELSSYTRTFHITDSQRLPTALDVQGVNPPQPAQNRAGTIVSIPNPGDSICTSFPSPPSLPLALREINWGSGGTSAGVFDPPAPASAATGRASSSVPLTPEALHAEVKKDPGMRLALFQLKQLASELQWPKRGGGVTEANMDQLFVFAKSRGNAEFDRSVDNLTVLRNRDPEVFRALFFRLTFTSSGQ